MWEDKISERLDRYVCQIYTNDQAYGVLICTFSSGNGAFCLIVA